MKKNAIILLADGFEEIEAITPYDLLNEAGVETKLISVSDETNVTGTNGLKVIADGLLKEIDTKKADCLIIPGGAGYQILKKEQSVLDLIQSFAKQPDKVLGAICEGSSILGELGIYQGKNYTCVPGLNGDFGGHYEKVHPVIDGNLVTGISVGGAMDFPTILSKSSVLKKRKRRLSVKRARSFKRSHFNSLKTAMDHPKFHDFFRIEPAFLLANSKPIPAQAQIHTCKALLGKAFSFVVGGRAFSRFVQQDADRRSSIRSRKDPVPVFCTLKTRAFERSSIKDEYIHPDETKFDNKKDAARSTTRSIRCSGRIDTCCRLFVFDRVL